MTLKKQQEKEDSFLNKCANKHKVVAQADVYQELTTEELSQAKGSNLILNFLIIQADIILSFYCSAASLFPCCFNVIPLREYAKAQTSHVTQELLCIAVPKANFLRGFVFMNHLKRS